MLLFVLSNFQVIEHNVSCIYFQFPILNTYIIRSYDIIMVEKLISIHSFFYNFEFAIMIIFQKMTGHLNQNTIWYFAIMQSFFSNASSEIRVLVENLAISITTFHVFRGCRGSGALLPGWSTTWYVRVLAGPFQKFADIADDIFFTTASQLPTTMRVGITTRNIFL